MGSILFLFILSFMMGFVNSISGGGGVFGVPAMIAAGVPPLNALALNRISDLGNIAGSLKNYIAVQGFDYKLGFFVIPPLLIGAFIGASYVVGIDAEVLNKIVICAVVIGLVVLLTPLKKSQGDIARPPKYLWGVLVFFILGLWDGAFAMAGGTFGVLVFVHVFHKSYVQGKAMMTFVAVPETVMSAIILCLSATLKPVEGCVMFIAAIFGSFIGSKLAIKKGSQFIRYAIAAVASLIVLKIIIVDFII